MFRGPLKNYFGGIKRGRIRFLTSLLIIILISVFSFVYLSNAEETRPLAGKTVLVIHSYHHGLAWTEGQDGGISEVLAGNDIELMVEYLDTKRVALEKISELFADYLSRKYADTEINAIIVTDNNALQFISDYSQVLFPGVPVVFSGINDYKPEMLDPFDGLASGVVQVLEPKGTYALIRELQGEIGKLAVVSGTTPTAQAIKNEVEKALSEYEDSHEIAWFDRLSLEDLLAKLEELSEEDAVILCNFNRDSEGKYFSHEKSGRIISAASNAPVYAMEDHYLGTGVTGGYMNSSRFQGLVAGRICLSVLKTGRVPEVVTKSPNLIMFDYEALARFGLDPSELPESAMVINRPVSFYEKHKKLIWYSIGVFCLLLLALIGVSAGMLRARKAEANYRRGQEQLKLVMSVNNDGIFDWDIPTDRVYFNDRYFTMAGYEPNEFPNTCEEWKKRLHPNEKPEVEKALEDYFSSDNSIFDKEYRFKRKDGSWMWFRSRIKVVERAQNGAPLRVVGTHTDITKRKLAEISLRESENKLKVVFNNSYEFIGIMTLNGTLIETNQASLEFGGLKESDVIGKRFWDTPWWDGSNDQQNLLSEMIDKAVAGEFVRSEIRNINLKGEIRYIDFSIAPVRDDNGEVIYLVPEGRDITQQKMAENALRESETKYRTVFEQSADATLILYGGRFTDCNQAAVEMLGYSDKQEVLSTSPWDLSPRFQHDGRLSKEKAEEMIAAAVERGSCRFEWDHKRYNDEVFPVEVLLTNVSLRERSFIYVVWRDITDRKRAEEERERNRFYLQRAQEIGQIGSWELNLEKKELTWTNETYNIFGIWPGTEISYEMFSKCVHPDDRSYVESRWIRAVRKREPYDIEHRILIGSQVKWVREKAELEFDEKGNCIRGVGLTQDITDRKESERQMEELVNSLQYKNKELQDIVYTASHDLRSPLVNIEGFSSELKSECDFLNELLEKQSEGVDTSDQIHKLTKQSIPDSLGFIIKGAQKMSSLLDGLLQISRIGTVKINRELLNVNEIVQEIFDMMEHQRKTNDVKMMLNPLPACIADRHMMDHVFTNLISNALKFRDPAKESKIRVSGYIKGDMSVYCVEDNGIGIAKRHQKKVFEIFHRLNPEEYSEGEGLGLTIVSRIMDRLGGKIWLESEPGKGSKFFAAIPNK